MMQNPRLLLMGRAPKSPPSPQARHWATPICHSSQRGHKQPTPNMQGRKHQHASDTFYTYSRGPTHRSLTDIGGGYSLEGTGFPRTTTQPSQPAVFTFHLRASPGLQFNQVPSTKPKVWSLKNLWPPRGLSTTRSSTIAYIYA
jgi:hypothetical protein